MKIRWTRQQREDFFAGRITLKGEQGLKKLKVVHVEERVKK